jgi:AraC family L-rhamnose operon regulatory protein RhaS
LSHDTLPGLKTIGHWDARTEQQWGLPPHRNEGIEISFLESGRVAFTVEDCEQVLQPGDLTITRPWQLHKLGNPHVGSSRLHWLILDMGVRRPNQKWKWPRWVMLNACEKRELETSLRHNEQPVWPVSGEIRDCFRAIGTAVEKDKQGSNSSRLAIRVSDLFLLMLDMFRHRCIRLDRSLAGSRRTVQLFLAGLCNRAHDLAADWTVESMAEECGLKPTQFVHYVKHLTNAAPMHYLNDCRLQLATKLLHESNGGSVTEVALASGFCSSQYFATLFRRRFGCTPKAYKERTGSRKYNSAT